MPSSRPARASGSRSEHRRDRLDRPRAGRLSLTLAYRAGLSTHKTSYWLEPEHEPALPPVSRDVPLGSKASSAPAARTGGPPGVGGPPSRLSTSRSRGSRSPSGPPRTGRTSVSERRSYSTAWYLTGPLEAAKIVGKSMIPSATISVLPGSGPSHVIHVEQLDAVAVALEELHPDSPAVGHPVQVEPEHDVLGIGVRHEDVVRRLVPEHAWNSQLWLWIIRFWPCCRASAPRSLRYSA